MISGVAGGPSTSFEEVRHSGPLDHGGVFARIGTCNPQGSFGAREASGPDFLSEFTKLAVRNDEVNNHAFLTSLQ
jgi:hypothetical protein